MPSIVLTQPISASGGIPGTITTGVNVPFNTTTTVDVCECATNMSVKWLYTLMDSTDETVVSAEVLALHKFGTTTSYNWYGIIGDIATMKHNVNVDVVSVTPTLNNIELQITNNDTGGQDWIGNIVRIQMLGI